MSSNLKRVVSKTLATWLAGKVPSLVGKIHTVASGPNEDATYPCAAILPQVLSFEPFQAAEVWAQDPNAMPFTDDGKTLLTVGDFTGVYELRLYARTVEEREVLEDQVLHALMAEEGRPGVVSLTTPVVTVGGFATLYGAPCAFMLDKEVWSEEFAFENRRFSFLDLDVIFPALVLRDAYMVKELYLAINHDLDSDVPEETFLVNEDGTTTEV